MSREFTAKVITANALVEGDVVWLTEDDIWTRDMRRAEVLTDEAHAEIRLLEASARTASVVGVYLAEVSSDPSGPQPTHFREDFRRRGPSNYFHGKQAGL